MSTDREASLPIEDWGGVNLNYDSEDIQPNQLLGAQNLWEKTIGVLETRYGSETVAYKPSAVEDNALGNIHKIYKSWGETKRFCAINCTPDTAILVALPAGVAVSFVDDSSGYWNNDHTFGASNESGITLNFTHPRIFLRFVGYGVDKYFELDPTAVSGYSASTNQKLRIAVDNTFDNSKTTGIEVYATVMCGETETSGSSNYNEQTLWVGFIDVTTDTTQTKDFLYSPASYDSSISAATSIGSSERSFSVSAFISGTNNVDGSFVGGKTYYVAVLPQWTVFSGGVNTRCCYRQPTADVFGGEIVPITVPGTSTGYLMISAVSPNTTAFLVAIGETPQTLQPYFLFNDSEGKGDTNPVTTPTLQDDGTFILRDPTTHNPGVVDLVYTADGIATLSFRFSDYSRQDMFLGINDDDTTFPIFCSRLSYVNDSTGVFDVVGDFSSLTLTSPSSWAWFSVNEMDKMPRMGNNARYVFASWQNYALFVNDHNPIVPDDPPVVLPSADVYFVHRTNTSYFICDGQVAAPVIEDYQATQITLPLFRYIASFDSSIVLGGGTPVIDPRTGLPNDASKTMYFSRANNPFDFTIPGASSTTHQTVSLGGDNEDLVGFGIYTNTTSDQGPLSQLVVTKKSATWIMNSLPSVSSGALTGFSNRILSKKVGGFHLTFVNTPIGLLMAGPDNVYLLREDGEPTPMGQGISELLKAANMEKAVACYHDKHYKLSFSHPDYSGYQGGEHNNVEMWLNINKVIENKGREDWVGPMIGRGVDYVFVEDQAADGIAYDAARSRYVVDKYASTGRIYRADVLPSANDDTLYDMKTTDGDASNLAVTSILETKNFDITQQDNNWNKLLKRFYIKLRSNWVAPTAPATNAAAATHEVFMDGSSAGTVNFGSDVGDSGAASFYTRPLRLIGLFPPSRLRGRTIKFKFTFTKRIAIGGIQVNYQIERRRA